MPGGRGRSKWAREETRLDVEIRAAHRRTRQVYGADHCHNMHDPEFQRPATLQGLGILEPVPPLELSAAKVRVYRAVVNWQHFRNTAILCNFLPYRQRQVVELIEGTTGWTTSVLELIKVGERSLALARAFNAREGFTAKDDVLPDRLYTAFTDGPLKDQPISRDDMQEALKTYYAMAGYEPEIGAPTAAKLHELDLGWVVDKLEKAGLKI